MRQVVRSVSGNNLLFYVSTIPWLRLQQEAEWVNINFERRDLKFPQKSHPPPMILKKFALSFAINLRKQNVRFFFHVFSTKLYFVSLNYYCHALSVSPRRINGGLSDDACSLVSLAYASSHSWYLAPSNSHIQE